MSISVETNVVELSRDYDQYSKSSQQHLDYQGRPIIHTHHFLVLKTSNQIDEPLITNSLNSEGSEGRVRVTQLEMKNKRIKIVDSFRFVTQQKQQARAIGGPRSGMKIGERGIAYNQLWKKQENRKYAIKKVHKVARRIFQQFLKAKEMSSRADLSPEVFLQKFRTQMRKLQAAYMIPQTQHSLFGEVFFDLVKKYQKELATKAGEMKESTNGSMSSEKNEEKIMDERLMKEDSFDQNFKDGKTEDE